EPGRRVVPGAPAGLRQSSDVSGPRAQPQCLSGGRIAVSLLGIGAFAPRSINWGKHMKRLAAILAIACVPALAGAADKPDWAFPVTEKDQPPPRYAPDRVRTVGNVSVTRASADDFYNIPNWRPDMYPAMPKIVQFGNKEKEVRACG